MHKELNADDITSDVEERENRMAMGIGINQVCSN